MSIEVLDLTQSLRGVYLNCTRVNTPFTFAASLHVMLGLQPTVNKMGHTDMSGNPSENRCYDRINRSMSQVVL